MDEQATCATCPWWKPFKAPKHYGKCRQVLSGWFTTDTREDEGCLMHPARHPRDTRSAGDE
jgi:hypothetical protein